jgi:hypothetical protein
MTDRDIAARVLQRFAAGKKVPVWNREKEWRTRVDPKALKENSSEYQRLSPADLEKPRKRLPPDGYPAKIDKPDAPDRPAWPRRPRVPRHRLRRQSPTSSYRSRYRLSASQSLRSRGSAWLRG